MTTNYTNILMKKAARKLNDNEFYQYDYLMVMEYIDSNYKKNKKGYLSYLEDLFYNKCEITLDEYQRLFDIA